jgi:hypothetical protein
MAMLASMMSWESDKAQKELEQLYNVLRSLVPWIPDRKDDDNTNRQQLQSQQQRGRLKTTLQASACVDGVKVWRSRLLGSASVVQFGGLLSAVSSLSLSPQVRSCMLFLRYALQLTCLHGYTALAAPLRAAHLLQRSCLFSQHKPQWLSPHCAFCLHPCCCSEQGPGCCDFNKFERVANVLTSFPYAAIGVHSIRQVWCC